jgi:3-dehydroquinate synthase
MITVDINVSKNYKVHIERGLLSRAGELVPKCEKTLIVTDDTVNRLYGDVVEDSLKSAGFSVSKFIFASGEQQKNIGTYIGILNMLSQANLTRSDAIIALGGGVTGDLAGFAAATYLRGIRFVQIPTTLLAMVDSSVGGKTGVNLQVGKNQVGAFYQPDVVICDPNALQTLPEEICRDGYAEIIKHAVIRCPELFELLKQPIESNIEDIIARNITIKRDVVAQDELDTGVRQLLNFGHTVGHGIETLSDYSVSHGSAVAIGMVMESRNSSCHAQITEMLAHYKLPIFTDIPLSQLINAAMSDKKRSGGKITLIIIDNIGKSRLQEFTTEEFTRFIS